MDGVHINQRNPTDTFPNNHPSDKQRIMIVTLTNDDTSSLTNRTLAKSFVIIYRKGIATEAFPCGIQSAVIKDESCTYSRRIYTS